MQKIGGFTIESELTALQELHTFCDQLKNQVPMNEQVHGNLVLAMSEAATNAIVHGNNNDPKKKVEVEIYADEHYVLIQISDEGEGFDPSSLPDPLSEENLLKQGGRGVFLIEQFADHVEYRDSGTTVVLSFKRHQE